MHARHDATFTAARGTTALVRCRAARTVLVAAAFAALFCCAIPSARAANCAAGWNDAGGGVCEKILDYNGTAGTIGTVQQVTVPAGVALMTMIVAGAAGQISLETGDGPPAAGGKGGRQTGTLPVVAGDVLNVFVGQWGRRFRKRRRMGGSYPIPTLRART